MHPIAKSRFASGSRCPINDVCTTRNLSAAGPHQPTPAQGLYDPRYEHDACGVGFVAHIKGQSSRTASSARRCSCSINLLHRGACGCEANTGDGAGILIQMPDRFLRKEAARLGHHAAAGARLRRRPGLPAARSGGSRPRRDAVRRDRDRGRAARARLARRADRRSRRRPERGGGGAGVPADLHRPRARAAPAPGQSLEGDAQFERKLYVDPQADRARDRRRRPSGRRRSASSTSSACRRTR